MGENVFVINSIFLATRSPYKVKHILFHGEMEVICGEFVFLSLLVQSDVLILCLSIFTLLAFTQPVDGLFHSVTLFWNVSFLYSPLLFNYTVPHFIHTVLCPCHVCLYVCTFPKLNITSSF